MLWLVNTLPRGTIHFNAVPCSLTSQGISCWTVAWPSNSSATDGLWRQWRGTVTPQWVSVSISYVSFVLNEMHMVCYKTDVDSPYLGKSIRLSPPPPGMLINPNQSICLGRCPREIDWFGVINMPSGETDVCCWPNMASQHLYNEICTGGT